MHIHLIFDANDLDNGFVEALTTEGHLVEVSSNYSAASRNIIKAEEKPNVFICSDNAFEGNVNDKYDYLTVYLQEIRQNANEARIILVTMKQPPLEFIQECKELNVELSVGGELDIDLSKNINPEATGNTFKNAGDISVIVAVPENLETRIRSINKVNVVAKAKTRDELEQKASLLIPDIIVTTFDLPGEEDIILITKRIPHEVRILMFEPEDMNTMVHDRLTENGVEFLNDISVDALEKIIVKNTLENPKQQGTGKTPPKASEEKKKESMVRGKRINFNIDRIVGAAGSVSNATQSVLSGASRSVSNAAKNFKLSIKSKVNKLHNIIVVCSPVPTGKSFFAANISTKLVELGHKVTLIDLSHTQAQHTYFKMDTDEDSLKRAIEFTGKDNDDYDSLAYEPKRIKGLSIYACDPDIKVKFSSSGILKLLNYASQTSDFVIIDMPQVHNGGFAAAVMSAAALTFVVSDMDLAHVSIFTRSNDFEEIENKVLVINKYLQASGINIAQIRNAINVDQERILTIPCRYNAVIQGVYSGMPACMFDSELADAFMKIADFIECSIHSEDEN